MHRVEFSDLDIAGGSVAALGLLKDDPVVLVQNTPKIDPEKSLKKLSKSLGTILHRGNKGFAKNLDFTGFHHLNAREAPVVAPTGDVFQSTTGNAIPIHTDEFFKKDSAEIVLLHCINPDPRGGESLIAYFDDVILALSEEDIKDLRRPLFPAPFGKVPVIYGRTDNPEIRYNRRVISESATNYKNEIPGNIINLLDRFESAVEEKLTYYRLQRDECYIIQNNKVLHGRTALSPSNQRHLIRVRLHAGGSLTSGNCIEFNLDVQ